LSCFTSFSADSVVVFSPVSFRIASQIRFLFLFDVLELRWRFPVLRASPRPNV